MSGRFVAEVGGHNIIWLVQDFLVRELREAGGPEHRRDAFALVLAYAALDVPISYVLSAASVNGPGLLRNCAEAAFEAKEMLQPWIRRARRAAAALKATARPGISKNDVIAAAKKLLQKEGK